MSTADGLNRMTARVVEVERRCNKCLCGTAIYTGEILVFGP